MVPSTRTRNYPAFSSFPETLQLHLGWLLQGVKDAFRWDVVFSTAASDNELRANLLQSILLNSLCLVSIYAFDLLIHPLVRNQEKWLHRHIGSFYQVLWLVPCIGASFYLNISWSSVIAKRAYALQHGTRGGNAAQPFTYTGLLTAISARAYRAVMVLTSVAFSFFTSHIPYVGPFISFLFFTWIDAYYFFEFVWMERSYSLSRRVRHVEERWAYYLGFGLPATALCTWSTPLANTAMFAFLFPAFIIMAVRARPLPQDPYVPVAVEENEIIKHPSPFIPIRIPIFGVVLWINDWIARIVSVGGGRSRQRRTLSESVEGAEAGAGQHVNGGYNTTGRVKLINRRKFD